MRLVLPLAVFLLAVVYTQATRYVKFVHILGVPVEPLRYYDAASYCQRIGYEGLVDIISQEEFSSFSRYTRSMGIPTFVGITRAGTKHQRYWKSDLTDERTGPTKFYMGRGWIFNEILQKKWFGRGQPGEEGSVSEECLAIKQDGKLHDVSCNERYNFICGAVDEPVFVALKPQPNPIVPPRPIKPVRPVNPHPRPVNPVHPGTKSCGVPAISPFQSDSRIVGGREAKPCSWPWQMLLKLGKYQACGATLISSEWAVSAAHCFFGSGDNSKAENWQAVLGEHSEVENEGTEVERKVARVIVHEKYEGHGNHDHDIALVQLSAPVAFSRCISPACLPTAPLSDNDDCYVTGFGKTKGTGGDDVLKQAAVPVIELDTCKNLEPYRGRVTDNMICAGFVSGGVDACQGDSGGPFVCKSPQNVFEVHGAVSWGKGCAKKDKPGVYARIFNYIDWIAHHSGIRN